MIDVLQHRSGLPSSFYFYRPDSAGDYYSQDRKKTIQYLTQIPLEYETGTKHVYSDIGYMLLGCIIENITGKPIDVYTEQELYKPLGLTHTVYNPLQKALSQRTSLQPRGWAIQETALYTSPISDPKPCKGKYTMKKHFTRWAAFQAMPDYFHGWMIWQFFCKSC